VTALSGWETVERVTESGGMESRQRVHADRPVVEASESGARWLGVRYWQAVQDATRGAVRARWEDSGGRLKILGGATLFRFAPPELSAADGAVTCRYGIRGGPAGLVMTGTRDLDHLVLSFEQGHERAADHAGGAEDRDLHPCPRASASK
jgi:hypothetical protein